MDYYIDPWHIFAFDEARYESVISNNEWVYARAGERVTQQDLADLLGIASDYSYLTLQQH